MYDDENEYENDDVPAAKSRTKTITKTKTVNAPAVRLIAAELLVSVAEPRLKIKGLCHRLLCPPETGGTSAAEGVDSYRYRHRHRYISLD